MRRSASTSTKALFKSLQRLDNLLEREFRHMEGLGILQDHPARGLFLDPDYVEKLLSSDKRRDTDRAFNFSSRRQIRDSRETFHDSVPALDAVVGIFSLSGAEQSILLLALAPEIDPRYETIYSYLQNDVTKKRPTIDLAHRLFVGADRGHVPLRRCFHPERTLLREHLITIGDGSFPSRTVQSDARLASFVLGDDLPDERLAGWTELVEPECARRTLSFPEETVQIWRRATKELAKCGGVLVLRGHPAVGKLTIASVLCGEQNLPVLIARPPESLETWADRLVWLRREAKLRAGAVYLELEAENLLEEVKKAFHGSGLCVICGRRRRYDDDRLADYSFEVPALQADARQEIWKAVLGCKPDGLDEVSSKFALTDQQTERAARDSIRRAALRGSGKPVSAEDLHEAARFQAGSGLCRLATRVELAYGWDQLVLPAHTVAQLREICTQVRYRESVYRKWGFASSLGPARGIAVLFAGPSGSGKTMSAGVIARELGLELYRIDLASIVSKYIGETEKNLSQIFEQAEDSNAILFFDEADALFGKRSEVKDAHDRYANLEVAYLLQRIETYSGIAILATNLAANIDEAFARRMAHLVEFPFPDAVLRERLWRKSIPAQAPLANDVSFGALANQFHVSGGNIRNITLAAAFPAAARGSAITMEDLIRATARELEKIGRQPSRAEFQSFYSLVEHRK